MKKTIRRFPKRFIALFLAFLMTAMMFPLETMINVSAVPGETALSTEFIVTDAENNPLANASVDIVLESDSATKFNGVTDALGICILSDVLFDSEASYAIKVKLVGYATHNDIILIDADNLSFPIVLNATEPLIIRNQTVGVNITEGENFSLSVVAENAAIYQWYKNNTLIPGANSTDYSVNDAQTSHTGDYFCKITGIDETVVIDSEIVTVSVKKAVKLSLSVTTPIINFEDIELIATLLDIDDNPIVGVNINFSVPGVAPSDVLTDEYGQSAFVFKADINGDYITAPITVKFEENETYVGSSYFIEEFNVNSAFASITLADNSETYNGSEIFAPQAIVSGKAGEIQPVGTVQYTYYTDSECTSLTNETDSGSSALGSAPRFAGTYYVIASYPGDANYSPVSLTAANAAKLVINKKTITVLPDSEQKKIYNTSEPVLTYTFSGQVSGEIPLFNGKLSRVTSNDYIAVAKTFKILSGNLTLVDNANENFFSKNYNLLIDNTVDFTVEPFQTTAAASSNDVSAEDSWAIINPITLQAPSGFKIALSESEDWELSLIAPEAVSNDKNIKFDYFIKRDSDNAVAKKEFVYNYDNEPVSNFQIQYENNALKTFANLLTFRLFFKDNIKVTIYADDNLSGVKEISYKYELEQGVSSVNEGGNGTITAVALPIDDENYAENRYAITFNIEKDFRGQVSVTDAVDIAGNHLKTEDIADLSDERIIVDKIVPNADVELDMFVKYSTENHKKTFDNNHYYDDSFSATFSITEANFDAILAEGSSPVITVTKDGEDYASYTVTSDWTQQENELFEKTDEWLKTILLSEQGDYVFGIKCIDRSGNEMRDMYSSDTFIIDLTAPAITLTYDNNVANENYYFKNIRPVEIVINEHCFDPASLDVTVTALDINSEIVNIPEYADYLMNPDNWTHKGDLHTAKFTFSENAYYTFFISFQDIVGRVNSGINTLDQIAPFEFCVDTLPPDNLLIKYNSGDLRAFINTLTFGLFFKTVDVTVYAEDDMSGIEEIYYNNKLNPLAVPNVIPVDNIIREENKFSATFTVPAQYKDHLNVTFVDRSGNDKNDWDQGLIVDNVDPESTIDFDRTNRVKTVDHVNYYNGDFSAYFKINETNFNEMLINGRYPFITVFKDGIEYTSYTVTSDWTQQENDLQEKTDEWIKTILLTEEGEYIFSINCVDLSGNEMVEDISDKHIIDKTAPQITVEYLHNICVGEKYFLTGRTSKITIIEQNFDMSEDALVVKYTSKDINNVDQPLPVFNGWQHDGDVHTAELVYTAEANYTFDISCIDFAGRSNTENEIDVDYKSSVAPTEFCIDKTPPNNPHIQYDTNAIEEFVNKITFDRFFKESVKVTVYADDATSGVNRIKYSYNVKTDDPINEASKKNNGGSGEITADKITRDGYTHYASFNISPNFKGLVTAEFIDYAGNTSGENEYNNGVIVDNIKPNEGYDIDGQVKYEQVRTVNKTTLEDIPDVLKNNSILYFNGDIIAEVKIDEANFYPEDVIVTITKTDEDNVVTNSGYTITDWVPATPDAPEDIHVGHITLSGDGDYIIEITYTDKSGNVMATYKSERLTIDTKAPIIEVEYDNNSAKNDIHFKEDRKATITITERNFRSSDVAVVIEAFDINDKPIEIPKYNEYLEKHSSWLPEYDINWHTVGEKHVAEITYSADARYTFSIKYTDLAKNSNEDISPNVDYGESVAPTLFTIDHKEPENFRIQYETNPIEEFVNKITFNRFFKESVKVTVYADDATSGVNRIKYSYNVKTDDPINEASKKNNGGSGEITADKITRDGYTHYASFNISPNFKGLVTAEFIDYAGNTSGENEYNNGVIVDNIKPNEGYDIDGQVKYEQVRTVDKTTFEELSDVIKDNSILYFDDDIVAEVKIDEANFYPEDVIVTITKTDEDNVVTNSGYTITDWVPATPDAPEDIHIGHITLSGDGDYIIEITYTDKSGNVMAAYKSERLTIDTKAPIIEVEYDNNSPKNGKYFDRNRTATITITERNFRADEVKVNITAEDLLSNGVAVTDYSEYLTNPASWTPALDINGHTEGEKHVAVITFSEDANYTFDIEYTDLARKSNEENEPPVDYGDSAVPSAFCVDKTAPESFAIQYDTKLIKTLANAITFGLFFKETVEVTLFADDKTSGVYEIAYSYDVKTDDLVNPASERNQGGSGILTAEDIAVDGYTHSAKFDIPPEFKGLVTAAFKDRADIVGTNIYNDGVIVDSIKPNEGFDIDGQVKYEYKKMINKTTSEDIESVLKDNSILYFDSDIVAEVTINEANFYPEDVIVKITKTDENNLVSNVDYEITDWDPATPDAPKDTHIGHITLSGDGDYIIEITYTDKSGNEMAAYKSERLTIDTKAPVISVSYDSNSPKNGKYFDANRTATITIYERNFRADEVNVNISAEDFLRNGVEITDYSAYLTNPLNWKSVSLENGHAKDDEYVAVITYNVDANYSFDIEYTDLAGRRNTDNEIDINYGDSAVPSAFCVDKTVPGNFAIQYDTNLIKTLANAITFGIFFKDTVEVTVYADDATSGVYEIAYSYDVKTDDKVNAASEHNLGGSGSFTVDEIAVNGYTHSAKFSIPAQFKGLVTAAFKDRADNVGTNIYNDGVIVDNIEPNRGFGIDGQVKYEPARMVNKTTLEDITTVLKDNSILYFNKEIVATVTINEANFYPEDVKIKVTKLDANNNISYPSYSITDWSPSTPDAPNDTHVGHLTIAGDGDYTIEITYTDKSGNIMAAYKSERLTVDMKSPAIAVSYSNNSAENEKYFKADRTATITITERNFRAEEVKVNITAKDILGADVQIPDYSAYLKTRSNWSPVYDANWHTAGDKHTAVITYSADANYTFDISYVDLSGRSNAISTPMVDYGTSVAPNEFTVDHAAPSDINISYDRSPVIEFLNIITFNFFRPKVTVTVSVNETTAGIDSMSYWYELDSGVSPVNVGGEGILYTGKDASKFNTTDLSDMKNYKISFDVEPQYRGKVKALAVDLSGNSTDKNREDVLVVDNIAPVINVSYENNDALNITENGRYYKADQKARITINEANFYEDDVVITVEKRLDSDASYSSSRLRPAFIKNGDVYSASLDFTENADYTLMVEYTDKSGNVAAPFTKDYFTVDKTIPVINVQYDNNELLNVNYFKAERTATVSVTEHNFKPEEVLFTLNATDDGNPVTAPSLPSSYSDWNHNGDVHTAQISYFSDAYYTFSLAYTDLAGNTAETFQEENFFVDKTVPTLEITEIVDKSANKGQVAPVITISDTNFDVNNVKITLTGANRGTVEPNGAYADIHNGRVFSFYNFEEIKEADDIYTLSAELTDKAGNQTAKSVTFSVNRFGSTYAFDESTRNLNGKYVKNERNVVIIETNVDTLNESEITMFKNNNSLSLKNETDFSVSSSGGGGQWHQYTYTVLAKNFVDDGSYKIDVYSLDAAGNESANTQDNKVLELKFAIDKTSPIVTVVDLADGKTYPLTDKTVKLIPSDNLKLASVKVELDGVDIENWEGDELNEMINQSSEFSFFIPGDSTRSHAVKITVTDVAGNEVVKEIEDFFVTTNWFIRYYNNKALFFGSIGGVILVTAAVWFILVSNKRKKEQ